MNIEWMQFVMFLPLLSHSTPSSLMYILKALRFLTFDLDYLSSLQITSIESSVLDYTNVPQTYFMFAQYGYNYGSALRSCW